ncbi:MAG TPA: MBL fold metallo-hydrolase, partial [bacterium]|nr:MBL fold metallo-hydrolase [bacterium]
KNNWIERVRALDIEMMCPQHGAIFRGPLVGRFLDWFQQLQVGTAT